MSRFFMPRLTRADLLGLLLFSIQVAVIVFITSFLLGSFLAGAVNCRDCRHLLDNAVLGLVWTVTSVLTLGHVPKDAGGGATISVWPWVWSFWVPATVLQMAATAWACKRFSRD